MANGMEGISIQVLGPVLFDQPKGVYGISIVKAERQVFLNPRGMFGIQVNVTASPPRGVQKIIKKKI